MSNIFDDKYYMALSKMPNVRQNTMEKFFSKSNIKIEEIVAVGVYITAFDEYKHMDPFLYDLLKDMYEKKLFEKSSYKDKHDFIYCDKPFPCAIYTKNDVPTFFGISKTEAIRLLETSAVPTMKSIGF